MPILYTQKLRYGKVRYRKYPYLRGTWNTMFYVILDDLAKIIPLKAGDTLYGYVVGVHDEKKILKYVPKPPKGVKEIVQEYVRDDGSMGLCLAFPKEKAIEEYSFAQDYYISFMFVSVEFYDIEKHTAKKATLLPFEIRLIPESDEINLIMYSCLSKIDKAVLSTVFDVPVLREAVEHVLDAYQLYYNGDFESARARLRNAVEAIRDGILKNVKEIEGMKKMAEHVKNLVRALYNMGCPGGSHRGPVPKITTEFMLLVVTELINYVAKLRKENKLSY